MVGLSGRHSVLAFMMTAVLIAAIGIFGRSHYRLNLITADQTRAQIQANIALHQVLQPRLPLPSMIHWTALPELGAEIVTPILGGTIKTVVEAGSGVSTLLSAYALERANVADGQVLSLDHDFDYAQKTREHLERHHLTARARVLDAPLVRHDINGETWLWYSLEHLPNDVGIDLLVIDGPPVATQPLARYPALPLLFDRLNPGACIILDDAARESERAVVRRWLHEYAGRLRHTFVHTARGTSLLHLVPDDPKLSR